jgi:hypothetical protein
MNRDRGEGFEGDFAACRRINVSLRIATSVSLTALARVIASGRAATRRRRRDKREQNGSRRSTSQRMVESLSRRQAETARSLCFASTYVVSESTAKQCDPEGLRAGETW